MSLLTNGKKQMAVKTYVYTGWILEAKMKEITSVIHKSLLCASERDEPSIEEQVILEHFQPVESMDVDYRHVGHELLIPIGKRCSHWIEASEEGVHFDRIQDIPAPDWIQFLKKHMEYEYVNVQYGTLVKRA